MKVLSKKNLTGVIIIVLCVGIAGFGSIEFTSQWEEDAVYGGPGVTEIKNLSDYFADLKGTAGDTKVYVLEGEEPGGTVFVLGGAHPNEPAGMLATVLLIENIQVSKGKVIVIPFGNASAYTHTEPQEAYSREFAIETIEGEERTFRFGSRYTNPIHQWPDPDIFVHSSGQTLSGVETRNLNRAFPGNPDGYLTKKIAYGIMELIRKEEADVSIDIHEASPEYHIVNAMVAHQDATSLAAETSMELQMENIRISVESSPERLRGLSHREWGDFSDTKAILFETANPSQGLFRGRGGSDLVLSGKDDFYLRAAEMDLLYVPYDEEGKPIEWRVNRHLRSLEMVVEVFSRNNPGREIQFKNIPSGERLVNEGIGAFLLSGE